MTNVSLERLRECREFVAPVVMDVKAPVALLEYEPLGFAAMVGANAHAVVLREFLTEPDRVYGGYLPECEGLRHLYRELRAGLEWYLREGCPEMLWWVEPEPRTPDL
ncbi:hypothetical protein [Methanopyrus kandleri]|nr:hypothetical protein [Methanopyrus kandleri]